MVNSKCTWSLGLAGFLAMWGWNAAALELSIPGNARLTIETTSEADTYFFASGPYEGQAVPAIENEGRIFQQAWRLDGSDLTSLQIMSPIREQLKNAGYKLLFECSDTECGSFDFRFNIAVIDAPDMFVDLYDFRYLSAFKDDEQGNISYVALLVSRSGAKGYVQVAYSTPTGTVEPHVEALAAPTTETPQGVVGTLVAHGHVVLDDLEFESGAAALGDGPYTSLSEDSTRRLALVGHTDATGGSDANVTLSRLRAAAVVERLIKTYNIDRLQLEADGVGYISPIASNLTAEGRDANRRVEAVLLNTE